jgi:hypothetical protein
MSGSGEGVIALSVQSGVEPGAQRQRPQTNIAKSPERITMLHKMHRIYSAMGQPAIGMFVERPALCEAGASRTVHIRAWAA